MRVLFLICLVVLDAVLDLRSEVWKTLWYDKDQAGALQCAFDGT